MTTPLPPIPHARLARIALSHVEREYPHKADHVMSGEADVYRPRAVHPIFYGSFDWHSCVHGHWLLARLRRQLPDSPEAGLIAALFERQFTESKVAAEFAYLQRADSRGFERPYGWGWLLKLAAELETDPIAAAWAQRLRPLARAFAERFAAHLPTLTYPIRVGTHFNTAFALRLAHEYAVQVGDEGLARLIDTRARHWFGDDRDGGRFEPGGDDFLSSTLTVAQLMARLLPADAFAAWLRRCLPGLERGEPASLFAPAVVSDRSDGKIAHLDGLNLSRAWAWFELAGAVEGELRAPLAEIGRRHLDAAFAHISGNYAGEHWLATYALLALQAGHALQRA
ncbi:MAG: DUF2891 domain-containing protein [Pseudoxanthomonas sp.]